MSSLPYLHSWSLIRLLMQFQGLHKEVVLKIPNMWVCSCLTGEKEGLEELVLLITKTRNAFVKKGSIPSSFETWNNVTHAEGINFGDINLAPDSPRWVPSKNSGGCTFVPWGDEYFPCRTSYRTQVLAKCKAK